ncbi:MAG TPA: shikimate dehydrogenase, partial [Acidimicrobiales bacterium]|nr:shikimate dehydrogenase [Acidimicrobiales bacterium]
WEGADLVGHNTDGAGLIAALASDPGFDPAGASCVVVGAGGAARAVILALADAGAAEVAVVNRNRDRAEQAADLAGSSGRVGSVADVRGADLVVQATPLGMAPGRDPLPFDPDLMDERQVLAELIYHPSETPLMAAVRARGVTAVNGSGMLLHQAARAFELWTGRVAPLDAMADALGAGAVR